MRGRRRTPGYLADELRAPRQFHATALGDSPGPADRVFLPPKQRPLDRHGNSMRILLGRLLACAGVRFKNDDGTVAVDVHAFRRSCGTRLARHAGPLPGRRRRDGAQRRRLTARYYVDLRVEDTRRSVEEVPEVTPSSAQDHRLTVTISNATS